MRIDLGNDGYKHKWNKSEEGKLVKVCLAPEKED